MKEKDLERLIEKYYKGTSTEEEEMRLRGYFRNHEIPGGYEAEKAIFRYYEEEINIPEPSPDFESRIISGIDSSDRSSLRHRFRRYILPSMSAAASVLILVASYFFFIHRSLPADTYSDPEIAYAETMKILMDVSVKLNHGSQALRPVGKINEMSNKGFEAFNKSTVVIEKNLKNLNYLPKAIEIADPDE
jgi:hypothetical protein